MRFAFSADQDMLRDAVRDLFADLCTPDALRASAESSEGSAAGSEGSGGGGVPGLWQALADMGVLAALVPEDSGGLGLDEVDMVRVLEEAGYAGVPEPLSEHAAVAVPALAEGRSDLLDDAMAGRSLVSVALDAGPVPWGAAADAIVADLGRHRGNRAADGCDASGDSDSGLAVVSSWTATPLASIDPSRRLAGIAVGQSTALSGADADLARDRAALGAAADCVGTARRLLDITVGYVAERHQFGKPVGSYQAVKHQLADVRIGIEFAAPLVYRAAWSVAQARSRPLPDGHAQDRAVHVSMAKAMASDAVDRACRASLQCHGAIGYTREHDLQIWLKRGWTRSAAHGDARSHRDRVAAAIGI